MQKHPLTEYPENERIDYLCLVASIASADGNVSDEEITQLRKFCTAVEIDEFGIGTIINAVEDQTVIDIPAIVRRLTHTELKFTLVTDMFFMAQADGIISSGEQHEIYTIAEELKITQDQLAAIDSYVKAVISARHPKASQKNWKNLGSEIAGVLASAGVPLGTVAIAGTVLGDEITSALSVLGLGLGTPTGVGVAVSIGMSSYFGVRWLFEKLFAGNDGA